VVPAPGAWPASALWVGLVAVAIVWGAPAAGQDVGLGAAPFAGRWDPRLGPNLVAALVVAGGVVAFGPMLAARARWSLVAASAGIGSVAWAVSLAMVDGWDRLTSPLTSRHEYEPYAETIASAPRFVRGFVEAVPDLPVHVKGHPPGATLVPWVLDRLGLGGTGWFATLVILGWGVAVVAALVTARAVAGEAAARRAAPALVLLPGAVWAATSADALFAGVLSAGVALSASNPGNRRWSLTGGLVLGMGLLLTYGGVLILLVPAALALQRRRPSDLLVTLAGVGAVLLAAAAFGFWWPAGVAATRVEYWAGIAAHRPLAYLALAGNPGVLAVAVGPAAVAGLIERGRGWLPVAGLAAVAAANASLLSAGETERIWLPFVVWIALAAPGHDRRWLAASAAVGVGVQVALRSPW